MELASVPVRTKRGCLWYVGISIAGAFGLLMLFIALLLFSPDKPSQYSITVSAENRTYLEADVTQELHGFPDWYYESHVYYVKLGGWFTSTQRLLLYTGGSEAIPGGIASFRRAGNDLLAPIEVVSPYGPVLFTFSSMSQSFADFKKENPQCKEIN